MKLSEQSVDLNLLQHVEDPQELNMLLKRVISEIRVFHLDENWRVKVLYRNGHSQSFIWTGEKILFVSDTKKLLDWLNEPPR